MNMAKIAEELGVIYAATVIPGFMILIPESLEQLFQGRTVRPIEKLGNPHYDLIPVGVLPVVMIRHDSPGGW